MESSAQLESTALALQIQAVTTSVEELTKQNQEMRQQLQQEENCLPRRIENNGNKDEAQDSKVAREGSTQGEQNGPTRQATTS